MGPELWGLSGLHQDVSTVIIHISRESATKLSSQGCWSSSDQINSRLKVQRVFIVIPVCTTHENKTNSVTEPIIISYNSASNNKSNQDKAGKILEDKR